MRSLKSYGQNLLAQHISNEAREKKLGRKILLGTVLARSLELSISFPVLISVMLQFWTSAEVIVVRLSLQDKEKKIAKFLFSANFFSAKPILLKKVPVNFKEIFCLVSQRKQNLRSSWHVHVFPYVHTCICLPAPHPH